MAEICTSEVLLVAHAGKIKRLGSLIRNMNILLDPVSSFASLSENCRALKSLAPSSTDRQKEGELICRVKSRLLFHCHS